MKNLKFKSKIKLMSIVIILVLITNSCSKNNCDETCDKNESLNISTGINSTGNSLSIGGVDPNWNVISSPNPAGTPALNSTIAGTWQPIPVALTNAGWINCSGSFSANIPGHYTFERNITVVPGTSSLSFNFKIAYDDALDFCELIDPSGTVIPITITPTTTLHLSTAVTNMYTNPISGVWKIRVKVFFIDNFAGFLASGYVNTVVPCDSTP